MKRMMVEASAPCTRAKRASSAGTAMAAGKTVAPMGAAPARATAGTGAHTCCCCSVLRTAAVVAVATVAVAAAAVVAAAVAAAVVAAVAAVAAAAAAARAAAVAAGSAHGFAFLRFLGLMTDGTSAFLMQPCNVQ